MVRVTDEEAADWTSVWIVGAVGLVGAAGVGGYWLEKKRRQRAEEHELDQLFADDLLDDLWFPGNSRQRENLATAAT